MLPLHGCWSLISGPYTWTSSILPSKVSVQLWRQFTSKLEHKEKEVDKHFSKVMSLTTHFTFVWVFLGRCVQPVKRVDHLSLRLHPGLLWSFLHVRSPCLEFHHFQELMSTLCALSMFCVKGCAGNKTGDLPGSEELLPQHPSHGSGV